MPGTFVLRPIEAKLTRDTELVGKMDPYCMFMMGGQKFKSTTSSKGGTHPQWQDSITMPMPVNPTESMCTVEVRDENVLKDDSVGSFEMDMMEVRMQGKVRKWYSLYHKEKPAGDLLLEATYMEMMPSTMGTMDTTGTMGTTTGMSTMGTMGMSKDPMMMPGMTTGMPMGTMGTTGTMGTMGMSKEPMMKPGMTTGMPMGTTGTMGTTTGTMPMSTMGTMGMNKDPMMMPGMTTGMPMSTMGTTGTMGTMGTMGSMQGTSGTMPSSQMGTMGMTKETTMHGGMTTGTMGTTMPSSQMSMNPETMMHGGMSTGMPMSMGTMGTMEGTMTCDQSGMTCTNPMHHHDKMKKD